MSTFGLAAMIIVGSATPVPIAITTSANAVIEPWRSIADSIRRSASAASHFGGRVRLLCMHARLNVILADEGRLYEALRRHGLATLEGRVHASRVATLLRRGGDGGVRLFAHIDRRSPQLMTLTHKREVLLVAYGPDAYGSPAWYVRQPSVPSRNYIAVHVHGRPLHFDEARPELTAWLLRETVAEYDSRIAHEWQYDPPPEFHQGLARGVAAFEIVPTRIEGAFKLSPDKPVGDRQRVIAAWPADPETAELMEAELPGAGGAYATLAELPQVPDIFD